MTKKATVYSLWVISEDGYENNAEFVSPKVRAKYRTAAQRLLKSQSRLGKATVLVEVAWTMDGKVPRALGADFLFNDHVQTKAMSQYVDRRLKQIGLYPNGTPRAARTKLSRRRAIDKANQAFDKPRTSKKKKKVSRVRTPLTVVKVIDRIKAKKTLSPCNPQFTRNMQVGFTPGVRSSITGTDASHAVQRFARCDWGDVSRSETLMNNRRSKTRTGEIRGIYQARNGREFWVVYTPQEHAAILLLPEEN